jgi:ribosomal protein S18 acetylase RimI-like enzyme
VTTYVATSVTLRPITSDDAPFLFALYASTRSEELSLVPWSDEQRTQFLQLQFAAQHEAYTTNYPGASLDVLESDGEKIGRLYVYRSKSEIRIIDIAILPSHRRHGIGEVLLRDLMREGEATNRRVTIHVEKNNPALTLYERLGFKAVEDKNVYWFMEWKFDQLKTAS